MWDCCSLGTRYHMPGLCFRRVITHPANSNFTYRIYTQEWRWTGSKTCPKMRLRAPGHPLSCGMCHWIPTWSVWTMGILSNLGFFAMACSGCSDEIRLVWGEHRAAGPMSTPAVLRGRAAPLERLLSTSGMGQLLISEVLSFLFPFLSFSLPLFHEFFCSEIGLKRSHGMHPQHICLRQESRGDSAQGTGRGFRHRLPPLGQIWGVWAELQGGSEPVNELGFFLS